MFKHCIFFILQLSYLPFGVDALQFVASDYVLSPLNSRLQAADRTIRFMKLVSETDSFSGEVLLLFDQPVHAVGCCFGTSSSAHEAASPNGSWRRTRAGLLPRMLR